MEMNKAQPVMMLWLSRLVNERARVHYWKPLMRFTHGFVRELLPTCCSANLASQQQINAKADHLARLLSSSHNQQQETDTRREVEDSLKHFRDIQEQIRLESPHYAGLTQPQALSLREIQQRVLDDATLLEFTLGRTELRLGSNTKITKGFRVTAARKN
jgi:hypothetical protein